MPFGPFVSTIRSSNHRKRSHQIKFLRPNLKITARNPLLLPINTIIKEVAAVVAENIMLVHQLQHKRYVYTSNMFKSHFFRLVRSNWFKIMIITTIWPSLIKIGRETKKKLKAKFCRNPFSHKLASNNCAYKSIHHWHSDIIDSLCHHVIK